MRQAKKKNWNLYEYMQSSRNHYSNHREYSQEINAGQLRNHRNGKKNALNIHSLDLLSQLISEDIDEWNDSEREWDKNFLP